jgi:primosomal protein N''
VQLGLAPVRGADDLAGTLAAITTAATSGAITPGEATELARVVEIYVRAIETSDFERRLRELEEAQAASVAAR